jgi:hypothetical protein
MSTALETAQDIVARDLDYICSRSSAELSRMAGKHVLITGGRAFWGTTLHSDCAMEPERQERSTDPPHGV